MYQDWLRGDLVEPVTKEEIFRHVKDIQDPEYPLTLEQLSVVDRDCVEYDEPRRFCTVTFTPTVPHCNQATVIGLSLRSELSRVLPRDIATAVAIKQGSHNSEKSINKQLADKERVAAAMENAAVTTLLNRCVKDSTKLPFCDNASGPPTDGEEPIDLDFYARAVMF
ncbi:putative FAM96B [Gregarina niphandrodes]|uniref:FAM96B n=1 Tax=Gregarina niphandrodes TaxID=110365 RepID=A0A023B4H9_GRENI|nr:putative FAM96B [Gregarina niphandrodes]EZG56788.1 putative FAM96B [Gregarina niphandrodes]|eukprot:XP_011131154.1 putative FAM96B [Gregarina niphandrodes]